MKFSEKWGSIKWVPLIFYVIFHCGTNLICVLYLPIENLFRALKG